jgi:putative peptidoglycan lipid II flippase
MNTTSRKTAIMLFGIRLMKLCASIIVLMLAAQLFGVGIKREMWLLSLNFVTVLNLSIWGPLNETFRAKFILLKGEEGEVLALQRTRSLFVVTLIVLGVIVVLADLFIDPITRIIAPSYGEMELLEIGIMLKWMLWTCIFAQATLLLSSILNAYQSFYIPEICGLVSGILNIAIIYFLSGTIGIYAFVVGNYISVILLLIVLIYQIKKRNIPLFSTPIKLNWSMYKPFILFSIPFFLPYLVGQANNLIEKSLSALIGGHTVASIDYAKKIPEIFQTVLTSVLTTLMVPLLTLKASEGNMIDFRAESKKFIQLVFLMLILVLPVVQFAALPISEFLFSSPQIERKDLVQIADLLKYYTYALFPIFGYLIFGLMLLSQGKNKLYAFWGMLAQVIMILINVFCYKYFGTYTFVSALIISHTIAAVAMMKYLPRNIIDIGFLKYIVLLIIVYLMLTILHCTISSIFQPIVELLFVFVMTALSIIVAGYLLKLEEIKTLIRIIKSKLIK